LSKWNAMLRALIALPFLLVLILFALSNREPMTLSLWGTGLQTTAPAAIAILLSLGGGFVLGALFVWIPALGVRRRARRSERTVRDLEAQVAALKGSAPAPGTSLAAR
jgi:putative membrane protein